MVMVTVIDWWGVFYTPQPCEISQWKLLWFIQYVRYVRGCLCKMENSAESIHMCGSESVCVSVHVLRSILETVHSSWHRYNCACARSCATMNICKVLAASIVKQIANMCNMKALRHIRTRCTAHTTRIVGYLVQYFTCTLHVERFFRGTFFLGYLRVRFPTAFQ